MHQKSGVDLWTLSSSGAVDANIVLTRPQKMSKMTPTSTKVPWEFVLYTKKGLGGIPGVEEIVLNKEANFLHHYRLITVHVSYSVWLLIMTWVESSASEFCAPICPCVYISCLTLVSAFLICHKGHSDRSYTRVPIHLFALSPSVCSYNTRALHSVEMCIRDWV